MSGGADLLVIEAAKWALAMSPPAILVVALVQRTADRPGLHAKLYAWTDAENGRSDQCPLSKVGFKSVPHP